MVVHAAEEESACPGCGILTGRIHQWARQRVKDIATGAGAFFHRGHGSVYTSTAYAEPLREVGRDPVDVRGGHQRGQRLGREFNATLKREVLQDARTWPDELTCRRQVFKWLTRYDTKRSHSGAATSPRNDYETSTATLQDAA